MEITSGARSARRAIISKIAWSRKPCFGLSRTHASRASICSGDRKRGSLASQRWAMVGTHDADLHAFGDRGAIEHRGTPALDVRSEEHTSELQSLMRISYAVFCLKKKNTKEHTNNTTQSLIR